MRRSFQLLLTPLLALGVVAPRMRFVAQLLPTAGGGAPLFSHDVSLAPHDGLLFRDVAYHSTADLHDALVRAGRVSRDDARASRVSVLVHDGGRWLGSLESLAAKHLRR
jgi:hypothetical protein